MSNLKVSISRMDRLLYEESTWNIGVVCCFLNYSPHFPHEKIAWVKEEFWNMSFEDKKVYGLNIPHQMHLRVNVNKHKIYHYSGGWYLWRSLIQSCEFGTINIHGVLSWTTWWPPSWNQTLITYCQKCSINLKVWNVDLFHNFFTLVLF